MGLPENLIRKEQSNGKINTDESDPGKMSGMFGRTGERG